MKKKLILLKDDTALLMRVFHKAFDLEELDMEHLINELEMKELTDTYAEAAKEFVKQLEGHWCIPFFNELIIELLSEIKKEDKEHGNDHLKHILELIKEKFDGKENS